MVFGKCFIADLFCGTGKNGDKNGSPLILIDRAEYILRIPQLQDSQIYILFNDKDKNNTKNLDIELKKIKVDKNITIFPVQNDNFEDVLQKILKPSFRYKGIPIFFFLDPFTYSSVKMDHLKRIMALKFAEVLLFLPIFHCYRFASDEKLKGSDKTRIFVEEFTTKGIYDYKNIDDFMQSIKDKLKQKLDLDFVRKILLDGGSKKHSLFLLTKSQEGMMLMNKIAIKKSEDGKGVSIRNVGQKSLFGIEETPRFKLFAKNLTNELKRRGEMTNSDIIKFTTKEEFLPKHAKVILGNLKIEKKLKIFDEFDKETKQLYVAEKLRGFSIFRYIS